MPDPSPEQITLTLNRADAEDINFEGFENASDGAAARFHESLDAALSLEGEDKCERCVWTGESPCPSCHGRGGRTESVTGHPVYGESLPGLVEATAAPSGARGADLELPLTNSTLVEEVIAAVYEACLDRAMGEEDASEVAAVLRGQLTGTRPTPSPYTKAFRERVCPVPEFPSVGTAPQEAQADPKDHSCHDECACQNGGHPMPDFVAPQTEGECPDCAGTRLAWPTETVGPSAGIVTPCPTCSGTGKEKA